MSKISKRQRLKTKQLVETSVLIALSVVLATFAVVTRPNGGAITIASMIPLILISFKYGWKWGVFAAVTYSALEMLLRFFTPPAGTLTAFILVVMLDYAIAFGVLGLAAIWGKKWYAVLIVCTLRFLAHFTSGMIIWGGSITFSLAYNASYMIPETIITLAVIIPMLKIPAISRWFDSK